MDMSKFEALEGRVAAMLERLAALTKNNEKLQADLVETKTGLKNAQADLEAAESLIRELQTEREAILAKVEAIILRLE